MTDAGTKEVLRLKYKFHEPSDNVIFVKKKFKEPQQNQRCQKKKWKVKEECIENVKCFASFVYCDDRTFSFVINNRQSQEY